MDYESIIVSVTIPLFFFVLYDLKKDIKENSEDIKYILKHLKGRSKEG